MVATLASQEDECVRIDALLARIRKRDESALDQLWRMIRTRVFGWVRSVLGPGDPEDAAQHVFQQLWRRTPEWEGCERFFKWVKVVAMSAAEDQRRRQRADRNLPLPPDAVTPPQPAWKSVYLRQVIRIGLGDVKAPHHTLCLLANKILGDDPLEIELRRKTKLGEWLKDMAMRCPHETPVADEAAWNRWLLPLRARMREAPQHGDYSGAPGLLVGQTCLDHYGLPADRKKAANTITKWVFLAKRRLLVAAAVAMREERFPGED